MPLAWDAIHGHPRVKYSVRAYREPSIFALGVNHPTCRQGNYAGLAGSRSILFSFAAARESGIMVVYHASKLTWADWGCQARFSDASEASLRQRPKAVVAGMACAHFSLLLGRYQPIEAGRWL